MIFSFSVTVQKFKDKDLQQKAASKKPKVET